MIEVWRVPRETVEWVGPIVVLVNGTPTTNFKVALVLDGSRPVDNTVYKTADANGPDLGILIGDGTNWPIDRGAYRVWALVLGQIVLDDVGFVLVD